MPWTAGKTLAENLEDCPPLKQGQDLLRPLSNPLKATAHIQILYGNLAPDGAVGEAPPQDLLGKLVQRH